MRLKSLISGLISWLPGGNDYLYQRYEKHKIGVGTASARYCYSVWLRHLVLAHRYGAITAVPENVAELGPGNSLGTGLAALISGATNYYAFDVITHAKNKATLRQFDELVELFRARAPLPDSKEFPEIKTEPGSHEFPAFILTDEMLESALNAQRLARIRNDLANISEGSSDRIAYIVPWNDPSIISPSSIDMIFSMSVLEHVVDLQHTYRSCYQWLKPGGCMSHEIDFGCHGHSAQWNGHWACTDLVWRIIRGNRPYLLNCEPHSAHARIIRENNFEMIRSIPCLDDTGVIRGNLPAKFQRLTDADLRTRYAYVTARKPR